MPGHTPGTLIILAVEALRTVVTNRRSSLAPPGHSSRLDSIGRVHLDEYMAHDATGLAELVARGDVTPAELLALARAVPPR